MGLLEKDALLCERINVRRLRLGMPTKAANPVVQIVDGDEQDVRPIHRIGSNDSLDRLEENAEKNDRP